MTARAQRQDRRPRGPFSHVVDVRSVPEQGLDLAVEANAQECAAVAADLGLPAVLALTARFDVARRAGERFQVHGELSADITQRCVVTLEDFDSRIEQSIEVMFAPSVASRVEPTSRDAHRRYRHVPERDLAPPVVSGSNDQVDPPDPIIDDMIDLGAVAVEFLALACDPYPRKPGVEFGEVAFGERGGPEASAFAALGRLKDST